MDNRQVIAGHSLSRRRALRIAGAGSAAALATGFVVPARAGWDVRSSQDATPETEGTPDALATPSATGETGPFSLPNLPYETDALAPTISEETMALHHGVLHRLHVDLLNLSIQGVPDVEGLTLEELQSNLALIPNDEIQDLEGAVQPRPNVFLLNAGGHYNHSLFWETMSPDGGGDPTGDIADAIDTSFGDFDTLKETMRDAAIANPGSGWVWVASDAAGALAVVATRDQNNPLTDGLGYPVFGIDHWEHSYLFDYGAQRGQYILSWLDVANWDEINNRYAAALGQE